jgi:hypothetical protein
MDVDVLLYYFGIVLILIPIPICIYAYFSSISDLTKIPAIFLFFNTISLTHLICNVLSTNLNYDYNI